MRLRTKVALVSLVSAVLISISAITVVAYSTWMSELAQVDDSLDSLARSAATSSDPLGTALLDATNKSSTVEVAFFSINKDFTVLNDSQIVLDDVPSQTEMKQAAASPITLSNGQEQYRLRTASLADGEYLLFASSLSEAASKTLQSIWFLTSLSLVSMLFGWLLVLSMFRKDLNRIENLSQLAEKISAGAFNIEVEETHGRSELDLLNNSLSRMHRALRSALEKEKSMRTKMKDFMADSSHELKTPLTVIRGYFELLSADQAIDEQTSKRAQDRVREQIRRMQDLIDDLLLLVEIEQADSSRHENVNLSNLLEDHLSDFATLNPLTKLDSEIQPNVCVSGSEKLLNQLLDNLFSNLGRYIPKDASVSVRLIQESHRVLLQIDDGGPGLPETAYREGVQHFQRFDPSRSRESGGTGLGISIMAAIVDQHGGTMQLMKSHLGGLRTRVRLRAGSEDS